MIAINNTVVACDAASEAVIVFISERGRENEVVACEISIER